VTDVRNFGFFVDVPGLAMSGLVPLSTIEDDFYVFDDRRRQLVGRRTRRVIRLGDRITVQVAKVDSFKKQVDFRLAAEDRKSSAPRPAPARPQPLPPRKKNPPFRPGNKPPMPAPANQTRRPAARPTGSQPAFRTASSQLPVSRRPLLKTGGQGFSKRRPPRRNP
jgi:ribonuclease R